MILGFGDKKLDKIQNEFKTYSNQLKVVINGLHIDMVKYKKEFSTKTKKIKSDYDALINDNTIYINDQVKVIQEIRETINNDVSVIKETKEEILKKISKVEGKINDAKIAQAEFLTVFSEFQQIYEDQNKVIRNSRNINLIFSFVNLLLLITVLVSLFYK